jgi:hypothetical protein
VGREAMEQIIVEGFVSSFDYLQVYSFIYAGYMLIYGDKYV